MSKRADKDFLRDIREAIDRIETYVMGMTDTEFMADYKTQDAVVRNLEIIGEATKNLSEDLRTKHPEIPWKNISGVRDRLIHHYFGVNLDIVWEIVTLELPLLKPKIEEIISSE
jgi:uncharacterized protein with HEPN domain